MGNGESVETRLALHTEQIDSLRERVSGLEEFGEIISILRVELGKLQMQTKVTWLLMMLVISGLVGVAFSLWQGGAP